MSARYGDKTRSGEPVSNAGKRQTAGGTIQVYEQEFTSPGNWTWPGVATFVQVLMVGGGGGGSTAGSTLPAPAASRFLDGGGGAVIEYRVPVPAVLVTTPGPTFNTVPVTIGAGGAGGTNAPGPTPSFNASPGGTSLFGPPTTAYKAGGGKGGIYGPPFTDATWDALPWTVKGSAASQNKYSPADPAILSDTRQFGIHGSARYTADPAPSTGPASGFNRAGGAGGLLINGGSGADKWSFGSGGNAMVEDLNYLSFGRGNKSFTTRANTGQGGSSLDSNTPVPAPVRAGASGIVIVRWFE